MEFLRVLYEVYKVIITYLTSNLGIFTLICAAGILVCVNRLKKLGTWFDLKLAFIEDVKDKVPLILGVGVGVIASVVLKYL